MSNLVGNPEDRFSCVAAEMGFKVVYSFPYAVSCVVIAIPFENFDKFVCGYSY